MASRPTSKRALDCLDAFELGEGGPGLDTTGRALRVRPQALRHEVGQLVRSEVRPSEPVRFTHAEGRTPHDLVGTTYAGLKLVSERFVGTLRDHGFTGWTTFPARVALKDGTELQGYSGLAVAGRCGPIDDGLSQKIMLPSPVPGGRSAPGLRGLCFPPDSWDGSDLFVAQGFIGIFMTEPVKDALKASAITNVEFHRLAEIERTWRADGTLIETNDS
jgi:hypothetical protein